MNKLLLLMIGMFIVFGLTIDAIYVTAKLINDKDKIKDKMVDCEKSKNVLKCESKKDKYVVDYNKFVDKQNSLGKSLIKIDKTKVKITGEVVENQIELTYVTIDGKDYTVVSAVK